MTHGSRMRHVRGVLSLPVSDNSRGGKQRNESAGQRSGSLAALHWSGVETVGIGGVRLAPEAAVCDFASVGSRSSKGRSLTPCLTCLLPQINEEARAAGAALVEAGKKNPKRKTFIFVNNRLEGNALNTIRAMLDIVEFETPAPASVDT